jgi:hypothetical protein
MSESMDRITRQVALCKLTDGKGRTSKISEAEMIAQLQRASDGCYLPQANISLSQFGNSVGSLKTELDLGDSLDDDSKALFPEILSKVPGSYLRADAIAVYVWRIKDSPNQFTGKPMKVGGHQTLLRAFVW